MPNSATKKIEPTTGAQQPPEGFSVLGEGGVAPTSKSGAYASPDPLEVARRLAKSKKVSEIATTTNPSFQSLTFDDLSDEVDALAEEISGRLMQAGRSLAGTAGSRTSRTSVPGMMAHPTVRARSEARTSARRGATHVGKENPSAKKHTSSQENMAKARAARMAHATHEEAPMVHPTVAASKKAVRGAIKVAQKTRAAAKGALGALK